MKARLHARRQTQIVRVSLGLGEKVERRVLERVRLSHEGCFAHVTTELRMGEIRELDYTFTGLTALKDTLGRRLETGEYETLLVELASVFALCRNEGLDPRRLLLDPRFVFVDERLSLRLAYLPLAKYEPRHAASLKWLLEEMSFARLDIRERREDRMRESLATYVREAKAGVTAEGYCLMLATSMGLALPRPVVEYVRQLDPAAQVSIRDTRATRDVRQPSASGPQATRPGGARWGGGAAAVPDGGVRTVMWDRQSPQESAGPVSGAQMGAPSKASVEPTVRRDYMPFGSKRPAQSAPCATPVTSGQNEPRATSQGGEGTPRNACTHALLRTQTGQMYSLYDDRAARIGRGSDCDIQLLGNARLSRRHARVKCDRAGALVTDLGSANGTVVDGRRLDRDETVPVAYGQGFLLGGEEFQVVEL